MIAFLSAYILYTTDAGFIWWLLWILFAMFSALKTSMQ